MPVIHEPRLFVPMLLDDVRNIKVVLSAHVHQLQGVVANMRKYKI
jgi:hypothetical protein